MTYDYSRAARERRQMFWEKGKEYAATIPLPATIHDLGVLHVMDEQDTYYFLLGVADTVYAAARDLAGLDQRSTPIEGSRK